MSHARAQRAGPAAAVGLALLAAGATGVAVAPGAAASPAPSPVPRAILAQGKFLVAARSLRDPNFHRTVVLLLGYDDAGAIGLVVNRPTDIAVARVLPDIEELRDRGEPVFIGGPVERDRVFVLFRAGAAADAGTGSGAERVIDGVWVTGSLATLRALAGAGAAGDAFHVFAGYAGWGPGQLDAEVARGDWHVVDADADTVFAAPDDDPWPELLRRGAGRWVRAPAAAVRASRAGAR